MSFAEFLIEKIIGHDCSEDAEINAYAEEFLQAGQPGSRYVDYYPQTARFREFLQVNNDGTVWEASMIVSKNNQGELLIKPEGIFLSDGK